MKQVFIFKAVLLSMLLGLTGYVSADDSAQTEEEIRVACQAEAQGARYPDEYVEECIEDKKQALKEKSEESKDAS